MKKILPMFLSFSMLLSGCFNFINTDLEREKLTDMVIEYLNNHDTENLKLLFAEYVIKKTPKLDSQIEKAYRLLGDKIVSREKIYGATGSASEKGVIEEMHIHPSTVLITKSNKNFDIIIYSKLIFIKDKTKEGISKIKITDKNNEENFVEIGFYIEN